MTTGKTIALTRLTFVGKEMSLPFNTLSQQHKRKLYTWTSPDGQYQNQVLVIALSHLHTLASHLIDLTEKC